MPRHTDDQQNEQQNDPSKVTDLLAKIGAFLEGQSVSLDGGWPVVTEQDMKTLNELVQGIIALRFGEDCDSDLPVEFRLVDRTRFESMHFWPLKYEHEAEGLDERLAIMHVAQMNLNIAHDRVQSLWKLLEYDRQEQKKGKEE